MWGKSLRVKNVRVIYLEEMLGDGISCDLLEIEKPSFSRRESAEDGTQIPPCFFAIKENNSCYIEWYKVNFSSLPLIHSMSDIKRQTSNQRVVWNAINGIVLINSQESNHLVKCQQSMMLRVSHSLFSLSTQLFFFFNLTSSIYLFFYIFNNNAQQREHFHPQEHFQLFLPSVGAPGILLQHCGNHTIPNADAWDMRWHTESWNIREIAPHQATSWSYMSWSRETFQITGQEKGLSIESW